MLGRAIVSGIVILAGLLAGGGTVYRTRGLLAIGAFTYGLATVGGVAVVWIDGYNLVRSQGWCIGVVRKLNLTCAYRPYVITVLLETASVVLWVSSSNLRARLTESVGQALIAFAMVRYYGRVNHERKSNVGIMLKEQKPNRLLDEYDDHET